MVGPTDRAAQVVDLLAPRTLGRTGLQVSSVCIGTGALGGVPAEGLDVDEAAAESLIRRALRGPFTFIDTSNEYGGGESERRIGRALQAAGSVPDGLVVATKVDPARGSDDFSGRRVRKSVEESLTRLGLTTLPLVFFHDPHRVPFTEAMGHGGAVEALVALREEGIIEALGVAGGPQALQHRYLETDIFDAIISHNRFTIVDSSAEPLMDAAVARGVAFINAAPFGGGRGILARGTRAVSQYGYRHADPDLIRRIDAISALCAAEGVPMAALALQFSLRDPRVASTIVGMTRSSRLEQTVQLARLDIPAALWNAVDQVALAQPTARTS